MADHTVSRRVVLGSGVAACASPVLGGAARAAERFGASPLRVGVLLDLSGPAAARGQRQLLGVRHGAEMINAGRGEVVRLLVCDTEGKVEVSRAQAVALLHEDEVDGLVGTSVLPTALPVMELAQAAGVPLIMPTIMPRPKLSYVFCGAPSAVQVPRQWMRSVAAAGLRRVALLVQDSLATTEVMAPFYDEAAANGLNVIAAEQFSVSDVTVVGPLRRLILTEPDAILLVTPPPFSAMAVREVRALGWTGRVYCGPSAGYPDFLRLAGPAAEGVRLVAPWLMLAERVPDTLPNSWAIQDFVASFTTRYGQVGSYAGYGADAVTMLYQAFAGPGDRARAREILEHMTYVGATGVFHMAPDNHGGLDDGALTTLVARGGAWWPDDGRP